jgi:hypothetical protein
MEGGNHRIELLGDHAHRAGLTGRPRIGSSASPTLRVDGPRTKQARIMRSIVDRLAHLTPQDRPKIL